MQSNEKKRKKMFIMNFVLSEIHTLYSIIYFRTIFIEGRLKNCIRKKIIINCWFSFIKFVTLK